MSFILDSTDKKIIKYLIRNSREKVTDIASFIGVTSAAIHQRLAKIKKLDLIKEYTLKIDEKKLGFDTCAFIGVYLDKSSNYQKVVEQLKMIPEVVEVHYTTGSYSLFAKLYAKDNTHLMLVLNKKIQGIKGITRTETFISLEEPINRTISL